MNPEFRAFRIHADRDRHRAGIETMRVDDLTPGEVVVKVAYSSINYKDALAGTGKGRILRTSPLNGGIDAAGYVVASSDARFREGDEVLCTGCGLSETRDGGYAEYARLDAKWTIPLPSGLTLRESMILGTAGFTAGLALYRMEQNGQTPDNGPIVVTGASGGVGQLAIDILTRAGYEAHAISGKLEHFDRLIAFGAQQCISRKDLYWGQRPLETSRWAGAIDNVGGDMLAGLTRSIHPYGNIACCGNAASIDLQTTVMPLIIRGVSLLGIASAGTARDIRDEVWARLASEWRPAHLESILAAEIALNQLAPNFERLVGGGGYGRTLVRVA